MSDVRLCARAACGKRFVRDKDHVWYCSDECQLLERREAQRRWYQEHLSKAAREAAARKKG